MPYQVMYDSMGRWLGPVEAELPQPYFAMIGARFRNGRQMAVLSQRRLAAKAGISQSVVSRFERGMVRRMSAERIVRLALALGPWFPFGTCPHDDGCVWRFDPRPVGRDTIRASA
jgi:hypothetical protein